ncbi:MAG: outer membrane beta-barrel protein [bacterium]
MKRFLSTLLILFMSLGLAQAQHKPESALLIFNVGFTEASPEDSDNNLNGNTFSLNYEKSDWQGRLAGGVAIAYSTTSADSLNAAGQELQRLNSVSYEVVPILLYGKVLFGSPKAKGYVGGGFGLQFSDIKYFTQNAQITDRESGFLVGGVAGLNVFLSEKILLNGNYNLSYLGNSYYKDGLAHNFTIGLGFQFY